MLDQNIIILSKTKSLVFAAVFLTLGICIPFFTTHIFAVPGIVFLPMHLAVFMAGAVLSYKYGAILGFLTVLISSILTGMPPIYPMMPIMLIELTLYGFFIGFFIHKLKFNIYFSLILSMIIGRLGYAIIFYLLLIFNPSLSAATVITAVIFGLPGIALQLILIPFVYYLFRVKLMILDHEMFLNLILNDTFSLIVVKKKKIIYHDKGFGINPLYNLVIKHAKLIKGSVIYDKVIGRAAALLLLDTNPEEVVGLIGSLSAKEVLSKHNINFYFFETCENILNKDQERLCVIEETCINIESKQEALYAISEKLTSLKKEIPNKNN